VTSKRLLLIGGGHSHIEVVRRFGLHPEPDTAVTLISPDRHTPYSGMLPGHIAGHYRFEDCHIDLDALCRRAGVAWIATTVSGLDAGRRIAFCANGQEQAFDVVAVDTGSTPVIAGIPGAARHGVPIKPVPRFLGYWAALRAAARSAAIDLRIAVVGAGAGGIELALAMQHRIHADGGRAQFTLINDGPAILTSHPSGVRRRFSKVLQERGITLRLNAPVHSATAEALVLGDGEQLPADHVVWVTGAAAPAWLRTSGLQTDAAGFIAVNAHLQSPSHACVFAAGDIATMVATPRPKSGVYAVRQGPPLAENLRRALRGASLVEYCPQRTALALISTGDRYAVASYGSFAFSGAWVWRWKDRIDTAFMQRYRAAKS
jgi:selenide,water dikinase